jgi:hypothetical protein
MEAFWKPSAPRSPIVLTRDALRVAGGRQQRRSPVATVVVPLA